MANTDKERNITEKIRELLYSRFNEYQKHTIKVDYNSIRFACPLCGDSIKDVWKKRGNLYFDSAHYHCYNCGKHYNLIDFLKRFGIGLELEDTLHFRKIIIANIEKHTSNAYELNEILNYGIELKKFTEQNGVYMCYKSHPFIRKRLLFHKTDTIGYKGDDIYLFNLVDDKIIGLQIKRNWEEKNNRQSYYQKFTLHKLYQEYFPRQEFDINTLVDYDKMSLLYGYFNINFNSKITVFEGAIDSYFMKNSLCTSTANATVEFLINNPNTRFFFDNDSAGKKKMIKYLNMGNEVFLWDKFIRVNKIPEDEEITDLNKLVIYLTRKKKINILSNLDDYFSNNIYDMIYI